MNSLAEIREGIGSRIADLLEEKGLKAIHLAASCNVDQRTAESWLRGDSCPRGDDLSRIVELLATKTTRRTVAAYIVVGDR